MSTALGRASQGTQRGKGESPLSVKGDTNCLCLLTCVCICVCDCMGACATTHVWQSEDNLKELVLLFQPYPMQVISHGGNCLYPMSHPTMALALMLDTELGFYRKTHKKFQGLTRNSSKGGLGVIST